MVINSFKRIENKYLIDAEQKRQLLTFLNDYVQYDNYCFNNKTYLVQNIYFDTINNSLISHSISKPKFKVKIRVRHYVGTNAYFLEWKQKTNDIGSKRRISMNLDEFNEFVKKGILPVRDKYLDKQIINEFNYFLKQYSLEPKLYLAYRRLAFFSKDNPNLRLTIDQDIIGSRKNFSWEQENPELKIIDDDHYILEIKSSTNYPLWLTSALSKLKIYKQSFSKYGAEYKQFINSRKEEVL